MRISLKLLARKIATSAGLFAAVAVTCVLGASGLSSSPALAAPSEGCPNEAVRAESNIDPATGQPFSLGLPECRSYEMVSPVEKQQHDALPISEPPSSLPVSPDGNTIAWTGEGDYAGAENYQAHESVPTNPYVAQRTPSGWVTRSAYPPSSLIAQPFNTQGADEVFAAEMTSEAVCGTTTATAPSAGPTIRCAASELDGLWSASPAYTDLTDENYEAREGLVGASADLSMVAFAGEGGTPFLAEDPATRCVVGQCGGLYAVTGLLSGSPKLSLIDVNDSGEKIGPANEDGLGALRGQGSAASDYHAISSDGGVAYFTATPTGGVTTVFARVEGKETVNISSPSPSQCTRSAIEPGGECSPEPMEGTFQGAAENGQKAFFTTSQQLVNADQDETNDLYEYDFTRPPGRRIVQVSGGGLGDLTPGTGASVLGVVVVSKDGSHIYFASQGVLTTLPNGLGQTAAAGGDNLYAYDTETSETKFVATLASADKQLWGAAESVVGPRGSALVDTRLAQATPDGEYLAFDTYQSLIGRGPEADSDAAQDIYRYDFRTGGIERISTGHAGYASNGNGASDAVLPANDDYRQTGATPTIDDSARGISSNGALIVFATTEHLQSGDPDTGQNESCAVHERLAAGPGCEVYAWHECAGANCAAGANGEVSMISDGQDPTALIYAGMSEDGSDIFFQTRTQLVGQDTDTLGDIYDARIDGGFPAPAKEASCSGESCQGSPPAAPALAGNATSSGSAAGNLTPGSTAFLAPTAVKPKPPTKAQELAKALKQCRKDRSKKKRASCEKAARKSHSSPKAKGKKKG